jgi:hypothetical protein
MRKFLLASVAASVLAISPIALAQHGGGRGGAAGGSAHGRLEFFRHRHIHVFIVSGPGWIWCDDPSWWYSPWWSNYCGYYDDGD